ncbi:MAG: carbohydrate ABC transporter permease [Clostridiales bacterium]|nr:carbohydrate ABC transporter permease [Clostridiales bacterium]
MINKKIKYFIITACIILLAIIFILPVFLTIMASFVDEEKINLILGSNTWENMISPAKLSLSSYDQLLFDFFPFYRLFWNSIIYSTLITFFALLVGFLAGFSFYYSKYRGKKVIYIIYILLMMMPLQVTILPNYIGLREMNLLNTPYAIILPLVFSPFGVVILRQYMSGLDVDIIEAARLETSSIIRILIKVVAPQIKVCISAVTLFIFVDSWSIVEQPLLLVKDQKLKTMTTLFSNTIDVGMDIILAASVIYLIPVLILYCNFSQHLEEGLALGRVSIHD